MAVLLAGWPVSVPGTSVNRLCGSSMDAAIQASRAIETGDADIVVAGGVESMTRAPQILLKPDRPYPSEHQTLHSSTLGWRMVNPAMPRQWTVSLGETAEILAEEYSISRQAQDEFAWRSHQLAARAWTNGAYDQEVVRPCGIGLRIDEGIRSDTTLQQLSDLSPAFRPDGTVTAGNSSPLSDGSCALLIAAENVRGLGTPLARIVSRAVVAGRPTHFGIAPVEAATLALARAGLDWDDVTLVELNEAFAAQSLACLKLWPGLDPAKVNVHGGAIAIGHPLGASGGRIVGHLAHSLSISGGVGVAAICIGVGQALALVLEN
jgi:acetyl-CoA acetyltransferase family protein